MTRPKSSLWSMLSIASLASVGDSNSTYPNPRCLSVEEGRSGLGMFTFKISPKGTNKSAKSFSSTALSRPVTWIVALRRACVLSLYQGPMFWYLRCLSFHLCVTSLSYILSIRPLMQCYFCFEIMSQLPKSMTVGARNHRGRFAE